METTATTWVQVAMRGRRAHLKMKKEKTAILKVTIKPTTHTHTHTITGFTAQHFSIISTVATYT